MGYISSDVLYAALAGHAVLLALTTVFTLSQRRNPCRHTRILLGVLYFAWGAIGAAGLRSPTLTILFLNAFALSLLLRFFLRLRSSGPDKHLLRRQIKIMIAQMPTQARRDADAAIRARLDDTLAALFDPLPAGKTVLAYMPLPDEIDLVPALRACLASGMIVALPRVGENGMLTLHGVGNVDADLPLSTYGIREPLPATAAVVPDAVDVVLVPGRAFDEAGGRLGRGKGYYDRLLHTLRAVRIALAYDEQIVPRVPMERNDERVDWILTPTRTIRCR